MTTLEDFLNRLIGFKLNLNGAEIACERSKRNRTSGRNTYSYFFEQKIEKNDGFGSTPDFKIGGPQSGATRDHIHFDDFVRLRASLAARGDIIMQTRRTTHFLIFADFVIVSFDFQDHCQNALVALTNDRHLTMSFAALDRIYAPNNRYIEPRNAELSFANPQFTNASFEKLMTSVAVSDPKLILAENDVIVHSRTPNHQAQAYCKKLSLPTTNPNEKSRPSHKDCSRNALLFDHVLQIYEPTGWRWSESTGLPNRITSYHRIHLTKLLPLVEKFASASQRLQSARKEPQRRRDATELLRSFLTDTGGAHHLPLLQPSDSIL